MSSRHRRQKHTPKAPEKKREEDSDTESEPEEDADVKAGRPRTPFSFNARDTTKRVIIVLERAGLETVKTKKVACCL